MRGGAIVVWLLYEREHMSGHGPGPPSTLSGAPLTCTPLRCSSCTQTLLWCSFTSVSSLASSFTATLWTGTLCGLLLPPLLSWLGLKVSLGASVADDAVPVGLRVFAAGLMRRSLSPLVLLPASRVAVRCPSPFALISVLTLKPRWGRTRSPI
jgi:hypothetical protein